MLQRFRIWDIVWLITFAAATSFACVCAAQQVGVTYDEPIYLQNGLYFWHTHSHKVLMQLGTMPLPVDVETFPIAIAEKCRGQLFDQEKDFHRLLTWMRHGNLVFWWLLLIYAIRLGRDLGGAWGGRIAVAALACEPNLLAHAALATTDIALTAMLVAFCFYFRRGRDAGWKRRIGLSGVWFGLALLSKASALAFGPIIMLAVELTTPTEAPLRLRIKHFLCDAAAVMGIGFAIAMIGCGSDFQANPWFIEWAKSFPDGVVRTYLVSFARHCKLFGNAVEAIVMQSQHNIRGHGQFLFGQWDRKPYWYYFPALFLVKLPLPTLAVAGWVLLTQPRAWLRNTALLAALLLLMFSVTCRVQIGLRLQFPLVAFLMIGLASHLPTIQSVGAWRRCTLSAGAAIAIGGLAAASFAVWPHGLAFTNSLWGGTEETYLLAGDSNCDWGQGLPELDRWHEAHGRPGLDVWYFGKDPAIKTMPVRELPLHCVTLAVPDDMRTFVWGRKLAVSTTLAHGYQMSPAHAQALAFLARRQPIDRAGTFLIYDFSDLGPPPKSKAGAGQ